MSSIQAGNVMSLGDGVERVDQYWEFAVQPETFDDSKQSSWESLPWQSLGRAIPNFGITNDAYLFRLSYKNTADSENRRLIVFDYPILDEVDFYLFDNEVLLHKESGDLRELATRDHKSRFIVFDLPNSENPRTIYFKIRTTSMMNFGAQIDVFEEFYLDTQSSESFYGGIYLAVFCLALYNLFLYMFTNDRSYLIYSLSQIFSNLFFMSYTGHSYFWIFKDNPDIGNFLFFPLMGANACLIFYFTLLFLSISKASAHYLVLVYSSFYYLFLFFLGGVISNYFMTLSLLAFIGFFPWYLFFLGLKSFRSGYEPAKYFSLAQFSVGGLFLLSGSKYLGIIPDIQLFDYILPFSNLLQSILISIALGQKIEILHDKTDSLYASLKKEISEKESLALSREELLQEQDVFSNKLDQINQRYNNLRNSLIDLERERSTIKEELELATNQLIQAEKLSSLGSMLAGIAHEINNPVNFIELSRFEQAEKIDEFEKYLLSLVPEGEEGLAFKSNLTDKFLALKELNKQIQSGVKRVIEINHSMRNASRNDVTSMEDVDLYGLIIENLTILGSKTKAFHVKKYVAKNVPSISCKRSQIGQVLMNIISNSADALSEKRNKMGIGFQGEIEIHVELFDEKTVAIRIEDNGEGVPEPIQEKIMEPFFTTKAVGVGTGLGLAISKKIIDSHSGKIIIGKSLALGGAQFTITLPI
jgi:hypothetical protein